MNNATLVAPDLPADIPGGAVGQALPPGEIKSPAPVTAAPRRGRKKALSNGIVVFKTESCLI